MPVINGEQNRGDRPRSGPKQRAVLFQQRRNPRRVPLLDGLGHFISLHASHSRPSTLTSASRILRFYSEEKNSRPAPFLMTLNVMIPAKAVKRCDFCGHSRAAHTDGVQCALCSCRSEERNFVQQSFAFRDTLGVRKFNPARKRKSQP